MKTMRYTAAGTLLLLAIALAAARNLVPAAVEARMNGVHGPRKPVSEEAARLHSRLFVADLHADSLLWGRDLTRRSKRGHVDLPRLREGGVALQVFGVVTKTPRHLNIHRNTADTDDIFRLALAAGWPWRTLGSLKERALYQAERLRELAEDEGAGFRLIRTRKDLASFLEARATNPRLVGGVLGLEGLHALEGELRHLEALHGAGFRMLGLAHFFDNEVSGSAHGVNKGGLTELGRRVVREMERRRMLVDLAHASARAIDEVLATAKRPVVVSHTGVRGTCDNNRNLTDRQLRAIAGRGGVVGIGYWDTAVCGKDTAAIARAIAHAVKVAGPGHVALGSDFDGAVFTPFDTAGLARLTEALLAVGLDEKTIEGVMGGNVRRLLSENLP